MAAEARPTARVRTFAIEAQVAVPASSSCSEVTQGAGESLIDGYDPAFERALRHEFKPIRTTGPSGRRLIRDIRPGRSKSDPGIQLVDMVCGASGKHIDGQSDYFHLIQHRAIAIEIIKKEKGWQEDERRSPIFLPTLWVSTQPGGNPNLVTDRPMACY